MVFRGEDSDVWWFMICCRFNDDGSSCSQSSGERIQRSYESERTTAHKPLHLPRSLVSRRTKHIWLVLT